MQQEKKPWYKSPWAWFIFMFPIAALLGCLNMLWVASKSDDGAVVDDYAKTGQEVTALTARDQAATRMGLRAQLVLDGAHQTVQLTMNKALDHSTLSLRLIHPTRSDMDQKIPLVQRSGTEYTGKLQNTLTNANWKLELSDTDGHWRLKGNIKPDQTTSIILYPSSQ